MNTEAMAKAYIEDAEYSLSEARRSAVRRAQECTELSLKAILRLIGVEYPRQHDVSIILQEIVERKSLPNWFISALPEISLISKRLAEEGGPAFYGEERAFTLQATFMKKTMRKEQSPTLRKFSIFARNYLRNGNVPKQVVSRSTRKGIIGKWHYPRRGEDHRFFV